MPRATLGHEEEGQLAERCRNHDSEAQTELLNRYRPSVLRAIRRCLARRRAPPDLDDDVEATFWLDLFCRKPWRLRAYRPERGPLEKYLKCIARLAVSDFLAGERRQQPLTLPLSDLDREAPHT